jgi:hypothetical protein
MKKSFLDQPLPIILLCLTLGLAPFVPVPHIVGKVRWVLGGAEGMQPMDYFDLLFHGFPWLLLIRIGVLRGKQLLKE